jgi:ubiquinone/menaquinone biosynthesis C-methylase UbiE
VTSAVAYARDVPDQNPMAALFDSVADTYDAVGVEMFQPVARGLVDALAPRPGERALDVGCGRGAVLVPLAEAVGAGGAVLGIDVSPRMVEVTAADVAELGLSWVDVQVGDAMAPGLPPASYDVVSSSLVLFFLPDPLVALRAWREVLVDGGRVGVSTFGPYDDQWRDNVDAALASFRPPQYRDARTTGASGPFASDAGMEQLLADAGYRDVRTVTTTISPRFDDAAHWKRWSMSVGQRQFWEAVPADRLPEVESTAFAAVERCRTADGRLGFDQQIRYTLGAR